jgi:hypothetical protein
VEDAVTINPWIKPTRSLATPARQEKRLRRIKKPAAN